MPTFVDISLLPAAERRILIIDDDEQLREMLNQFLTQNYECRTATNARQGLELMARESFALVLTDIIMPGMSGIDLLREVKARYPDTAVILLSGVDRSQRVIDAMRLGASDYLIKPCDLTVLEISVQRALECRALLHAARQSQINLEQRNCELAAQKAELERLQSQLVHTEKMASLGSLAAGVAHELNNPAGFIAGNISMLGDTLDGITRLLQLYDAHRDALPAALQRDVARLKEDIAYTDTVDDLTSIVEDCASGARRICDVVENLKTFSRLDQAEFKQVDLHDGLESTIRLIARELIVHNIHLTRDFDALPLVDCYAGQLNQVWLNLLINAVHAISAHRRKQLTAFDTSDNFSHNIIVTTRRVADDKVSVAVTDTGCGIPPHSLHKIFDPFFTTKPVGQGTGLGLAISYGIIERHQGSITVESREAHGTTFTVTIPIHAARLIAPEVKFDEAIDDVVINLRLDDLMQDDVHVRIP